MAKNTNHSMAKQMQDLLDQREVLQKKIDALTELPVEHLLAQELHEKTCYASHDDECNYFYGTDFNSPEKEVWVDKAKELLAIDPNYQKILRIVAVL